MKKICLLCAWLLDFVGAAYAQGGLDVTDV